MEPEPVQETRSAGSARWTVISAIVVLLAGAAVWWIAVGGWTGREEVEVVAIRNARAGVRYVGDAQCTRCHAEIAETYARHPMGRSLAPVSSPGAATGNDQTGDVFEADGFLYGIERRDGKLIHRERREDESGKVLTEVEGEVRYVLGSGTHALSFLIDHDGYLFESPLTWYSQAKKWDLSPGFGALNGRFERPIRPECLNCHANRFDHVSGTANHYKPPIFLGHAIGCERCHGPGELHVKRPLESPTKGPNIVNPADLTPALREDVCQQCHLNGAYRVARYGHLPEDYRPGLPLSRFETIFVRPPGQEAGLRNAGHVEQMHQSRCYQGSKGALGCISCHNPHEKPSFESKDSYFRERCLECHATRGCTAPEETRRATSPPDSCIVCHMPRAATSNIPHVATTIHRIPRFADESEGEPSNRAPRVTDDLRLVPFPKRPTDADERRAIERDLAIALAQRPEPVAVAIRPALEEALRRHPDDLAAREALGYVLGTLGRSEAALATFASVLEAEPGRESSLGAAASLAGVMERPDTAVEYWKRYLSVNPWMSPSYAALGHQLVALDRPREAIAECRRALRLNPDNILARTDLIACLVRLGSTGEAEKEFAILLKLRPAEEAALRQWYASLR